MNVEQGVAGIDESKTLKMLGFPQTTIWSWVDNPTRGATLQMTRAADTPTTKTWPIVAGAPTVAELGEALKGFALPVWIKDRWQWIAPSEIRSTYGHSDTEANARTQLLSTLVEMKWIVLK